VRRLGGDLEEASMTSVRQLHDILADHVPTAANGIAGRRLLAFALSFDEIIVTRFTASQSTTTCRSGSWTTCSAQTRPRS